MNSFIGYRAPTVPSFRARRLKLDDPRVLSNYMTVLEDDLLEEKVFAKEIISLSVGVGRTGVRIF